MTVTMTLCDADALVIGAALAAYTRDLDDLAEALRCEAMADDDELDEMGVSTLAADAAPWRVKRAGDVGERAAGLATRLGDHLGRDFFDDRVSVLYDPAMGQEGTSDVR